MDPTHMVLHVVDSAEDAPAAIPLTDDARIVLRLMASSVLFAGEATLLGLWTPFMAAEKMLAMAVEMLPQVTSTPELGLRCAAWMRAAPGSIAGWNAV